MSIEVTQVLNLEKHLKTCVLSFVCSPKATTTISKVSMAFFPFEANCDSDMLFFQFCHFEGIPKLKMEKHIHSFHWHAQNVTIPCCSHGLLPFLSVIYFFLPPFSTNYSSILPHLWNNICLYLMRHHSPVTYATTLFQARTTQQTLLCEYLLSVSPLTM